MLLVKRKRRECSSQFNKNKGGDLTLLLIIICKGDENDEEEDDEMPTQAVQKGKSELGFIMLVGIVFTVVAGISFSLSHNLKFGLSIGAASAIIFTILVLAADALTSSYGKLFFKRR